MQRDAAVTETAPCQCMSLTFKLPQQGPRQIVGGRACCTRPSNAKMPKSVQFKVIDDDHNAMQCMTSESYYVNCIVASRLLIHTCRSAAQDTPTSRGEDKPPSLRSAACHTPQRCTWRLTRKRSNVNIISEHVARTSAASTAGRTGMHGRPKRRFPAASSRQFRQWSPQPRDPSPEPPLSSVSEGPQGPFSDANRFQLSPTGIPSIVLSSGAVCFRFRAS